MTEMVPSVSPQSVVVSQARDAVESWVREFASLFATSSSEEECREEV